MRLYLLEYALQIGTGAPIPGYLIQTTDHINILIDTGFPADINEVAPVFPDLEIGPQNHVAQQLALIGLIPSDIRYLICTHFDPDHAGAHDVFPQAELIVQRRHYEAARLGSERRFERYRAHWDQPHLNYRLVDGDTILVPGVELIDTNGHVPGHQSVLVHLPNSGPVLLAIDAIPDAVQLDPATREVSPADMDAEQAAASINKLQQLMAREGVKLAIFGHDEKQWPKLRKAPDYYS